MLRITVELWPFGSPVGRKVLAVGTIGNDGTGTKAAGNYNCRFEDAENRMVLFSRVTDWPRLTASVWALVAKALSSVEAEDGPL